MAPKTSKGEKEKNQNIHVWVRTRPINASEKRQGSCNVVDLNQNQREICVKERPIPGATTKTFSFDKVFAPQAKQIEVYKAVVSPVVEEVLMGYNCTVFAYGQTSTGKTYTMEGERSGDLSVSWEQDPKAGIIPRAMHQIFSQLQIAECEFSVRVSYLEIYNEELIDLLGAESVENPRLKIYEDISKKGTHVIQGLEEVVVSNKNEVYSILEQGAAKRQTAATLMNATSSRSHSVFMVTIHIKENSVDGEELLKTGKLNLVDLAGSECVGRSGAVDKRAREAGNINQSLLTLGRVITALVEHAPHVPYRESKLTRLLQDSLGGRTKTSIIATISPASCNLEETLSTLDYAHRAKNITNRPEINQRLTKKALLKEYTEEIERLRRDLQASRDKNGVYLAHENYEQMQTTIQQQRDNIKDQEERVATLTIEMEKITELFTETKEELENRTVELQETNRNLEETTGKLTTTTKNLHITRQDRDEKGHLVKEHLSTEKKLYNQATSLMDTVESSVADVDGLHAKLDRKKVVEQHNETCQEEFRNRFHDNIVSMEERLQAFTKEQQKQDQDINGKLGDQLSQCANQTSALTTGLTNMLDTVAGKVTSLKEEQKGHTDAWQEWSKNATNLCSQICETETARHGDFLAQTFQTAMKQVVSMLDQHHSSLEELSRTLHKQREVRDTYARQFCAAQKEKLDQQKALLSAFRTKQDKRLSSTIHDVGVMRDAQQTLNQTLTTRVMEGVQKLLQDMVSEQHLCLSGSVNKLVSGLEKEKTMLSEHTTAVMNCVEETMAASEQELEDRQQQAKQHNCAGQEHIEQMTKEVDAVNESQASLQRSVSDFTELTKTNYKSQAKQMTSLLQDHSKSMSAALDAHCSATESLLKGCSESVSNLKDTATKHQTQIQENLQSQQTALTKQSQELGDWSLSLKNDLHARDTDVMAFIEEEMKKDVPTGLTPQRREFTYPRTLAKTGRHSSILKDFRKSYIVNEAMNIPVPDDTLDESEDSHDSIPELNLDDAEDNHNISTDSAVSSASQVSSRDDGSLDGQINSVEEKENLVMRPPTSKNIARARSRTTSAKANNGVRSRTPTPNKKTPNSKPPKSASSVGTGSSSGTRSKNNTPNSTSNKTRLPLRTSNP